MHALRLLGLGTVLLLAGCASTPEDRIARDPAAFAQLPAAVQERVRRGQIELGDDEKTVSLALGEPMRRAERTDAKDGKSEVWIYPKNRVRFSFGVGVGSYGSGGGVGLGMSSGQTVPDDEEGLRVEFKDGRVVEIERRKR
jgi:hypothetical protein